MMLWSGPRPIAALSDDGLPTMSLLNAAELRFRGPWARQEIYVDGDVVTNADGGYRRDSATLAGEPGQGLGWQHIDEQYLLGLVADRLTAANGGMRPTVRAIEVSTLRGRVSGAAGSLPA